MAGKAAQTPDAAKEARKLARTARRDKQRQESILRAQNMHQARLAFEKTKTAAPNDELADSYVGCSGWFYWHWRDCFYPQDMPTSQWFAHYTSQFKTVELNAPFYSWPTVATVKSWVRQAGRRKLCYTIKVSEMITHTKRFVGTKTLVKDFSHIADLLGPYMGCFLFQLPPSYHYTEGRLKSILSQLDHTRRNVVEFRHASWWNEDVYAAFRQTGTIFCSCSGPKLPDDLVVTADDVYIRFHGIERWYRHDYSRAELAAWIDRIRASGARRVWAYFNNDFGCFAIKNAKSFRASLKKLYKDKG